MIENMSLEKKRFVEKLEEDSSETVAKPSHDRGMIPVEDEEMDEFKMRMNMSYI